MTAAAHEQHRWPTPEQELLLCAILLPGDEAVSAWQEWKSAVDIDRLDRDSYRLLPLLCHRLRARGIDHPYISRFRGIQRRTWYKNQILFNFMSPLLQSFQRTGIRTLVLKGAAMIVLYYQDYGLRSMEDFDVLVPAGQAAAAIDLLTELHWEPRIIPVKDLTAYYRFRHNACGFKDGLGHEFDLHWHVLHRCMGIHSDDDFWNGASTIKIGNITTLALHPMDQLLHVCMHGWWARQPSLRWVVDAMEILTATAEHDWDRLLVQAQRHHVILAMKKMLNYLHQKLNAHVPAMILQKMSILNLSHAECIEYKVLINSGKITSPLQPFWFHYLQYLRFDTGGGFFRNLIGFQRYLQFFWQVDRLWQVPFLAVFKSMRMFWKMRMRNG